MIVRSTTNVKFQPRAPRVNATFGRTLVPVSRSNPIVPWLILVGVVFPPVLIPLGGINFTPGRLVVILGLIPALMTLMRSGRSSIASDFFAFALVAWMLASSALNGGFQAYVGAEALEFFGAYMAGRAFFFGPSNLQMFVRVLEKVAVVLIGLAVLDIIADKYVILDSLGIDHSAISRFGVLRASSVFEGAEHYGTFCVAIAAIFLYSERGARQKLFVGLAFVGCFLSLSSGPYMGLAIVTGIFLYDSLLNRYVWRWKAIASAIAAFVAALFLISDHPVAWIIVHATLDSQTGFFRLLTWNNALPLIGQSPFIGQGMTSLSKTADASLFLRSIDCLWLVESLRYGVPAIILLLFTMLSPILNKKALVKDPGMRRMGTGFSLAIISIGFIGLTVHFWDATWLLLSLCIGIRGSVTEYGLAERTQSADLRRWIVAGAR